MSDDTPALKPPDGVIPDFTGSNSLAHIVIPVLTICMAISLVSTCVRFYAQYRLYSRWTWADACILLAVASHFSFDAVLLAALPAGLGRHLWNVRQSDHPSVQYLLYVSYILYDPAITFAKISILLQFLDIFAGTYRNRFWYTIVALIAINVLFYIPETFAIMFSCSPREKIWDDSVEGTCIDISRLLTASGPFNVITDFLIFLLPMYAIWHLRIPVKKRIEVSCAFGVGLFGCLCSAVRIAYSAQLDRTGDSTFIITQNQMWANAEITAAILIANSIIVPRVVRSLRSGSKRTPSGPSAGELTLRDKPSWGSKVFSNTPRTLLDDLELDTPFPAGQSFSQFDRHTDDELVTMDRERDKIAPWFETEPPPDDRPLAH